LVSLRLGQAIEDAIRELLKRLDEYDPTTLSILPEESRDLFKKLYHYLLPREIRHNLGEYYTPDWLAQRLLNQVDSEFFTADPHRNERRLREKLLNTRWLDPACGSGTFPVLIIARMRQLGRALFINEAELLNAILRNVVGFDLNPLAVLTARVNYLLAIADLLEHRRGEVTIPVLSRRFRPNTCNGRNARDRRRLRVSHRYRRFPRPRCFVHQRAL
jgi:type I restriction-modification system DNA methylase subunit